jgi:hypothetical protein
MNLISKLTGGNDGRVQGRQIKPADVSKRLKDVEAALKALRLRQGPAGFAAETGEPQAVAECADITRQVRETVERIEGLTFTLQEAERIERLQAKVAAANLYETRSRALSQHAKAFKDAAVDVEVAVGTLAAAYKRMIEARDKAEASCPAPLDDGAIPKPGKLGTLLEFQIYRNATLVPQTQMPDRHSLPGWQKPVYGNEELTLSTTVASHVADVLAVVKEHGRRTFKDGDE